MKFVRIIIITSYLCVILNGQLNGQVLAGSIYVSPKVNGKLPVDHGSSR